MPRRARNFEKLDGFFHLYNRITGYPGEYPLQKRKPARHFWRLVDFYTSCYICNLAGYVLMGNHYHLVVEFEPFRRLNQTELIRRAKKLYGRWFRRKTASWREEEWLDFNRKLFDVSDLMHDLNGEYAKWFNKYKGRRGPLWSDRYKHIELLDGEAVADTLLYIELNPVRPGLVERPEKWKWGSARLRYEGRDETLIPLSRLFPEAVEGRHFECYRSKLIYRGTEGGREGEKRIPRWVLRQETRRGFRRPGSDLKRKRLFVDGLALGSAERVQRVLDHYRRTGYYKRRKNPVPHEDGLYFTLREQRSHAFEP